MRKPLMWTVIAAIVALGLSIVIHDARYPTEDSRVVWICSIHGNGQCGPSSSTVDIDMSKLLDW